MSLHRALSLFVVIVALLALSAGISLVLLTTYLHHTTVDLENSLQGVRLAEEMQIDLLNYVRSESESEKLKLENALRRALSESRRYVGSPDEGEALSDAARFLDMHFQTSRTGKEPPRGNLRAAFGALERFVNINIEQANDSLRESERLDELGDRIGITVGIVLAIGTTAILIWLSKVAFRPVFGIRDAMKEFATGRRNVRAPVHGPEELRGIAAQFNEMADTLARQHHNQAAFLAAVAHDLRNPIAALKTAAEILSGPAAKPDQLSSLMGVIKRQVSSLDRMVGDLLDSARIESGHLGLKFEECDARLIAQDAFNLFSTSSAIHHFELVLPENPIWLYCDRIRIEQVLNNLLSNAIKYSPGGGAVTMTLKEDTDEVVFQVADQGIGISAEQVPYIFEPFRRARLPGVEIPGVGLGLSVAQRIVNAHHGRIPVETEIGKGTVFSVHLPTMNRKRASA